MTLQSESKETW